MPCTTFNTAQHAPSTNLAPVTSRGAADHGSDPDRPADDHGPLGRPPSGLASPEIWCVLAIAYTPHSDSGPARGCSDRVSPHPHSTPTPPSTHTRTHTRTHTHAQTEGRGPHARRIQSQNDVQSDAAFAIPGDVRGLTSRAKPSYVPPKAANCGICATCKQQQGLMGVKCRATCQKCVDDVVLGAENGVSIEVNGVTATQYIRGAGSDITAIHYGTTVFNGRSGRREKCAGCFVRTSG